MTELSFSTPEITARVREWTSDEADSTLRKQVQALVEAGNVTELEDRFYRTLEFGTGGLRGLVGAGTNRMNKVIVARATQGLANYVKAHAPTSPGAVPGPLRAAVAHDSRHFSREFAETAACVLAANGIICHISAELRPTPYLSFAVRHLGCHTGIVVTASHNPKEYNGYKVYWNDGSQVVPPHDKGIIREVDSVVSDDQVQIMDFDKAVAQGMVKIMGKEMDEAYLNAILEQRIDAAAAKASKIKVVYTPLHGCGGTLAIDALERWGFTQILPEEEQMKPNGDFPTAASPNPEEGAALSRAIELARRNEAEVVLATDPDADRLGIAVRHKGDYVLITGNQLSCLLAEYILSRRTALGTLPKKPAMASTIVTTPLLGSIVRHYGALYEEVLTGFKWIANQARAWHKADPEIAFLYGTEESYGFLIGNHAMDKDGIVASCLTAEAVAYYQTQGKTLVDVLHDLYLRHEPRMEWQKSITMPGKDGAERIAALMQRLKNTPPTSLAGENITRRTRVDEGKVYHGQTGALIETLSLPKSDVVIFELASGSKVIARPSGTEPKIKFYFFFAGNSAETLEEVEVILAGLNARKEEFQGSVLKELGAV